jgi:adenylosuccinate lyase
VDSHLIDSEMFGHQWSTAETRALFSERGRLARWLRILTALAEAQAQCGIIPRSSAVAIGALDAGELDIAAIAEATRQTAHSTLGLIRVLRSRLDPAAAEHVYYGATVQDLTDTSLVLEIEAIGAIVWRDVLRIEGVLLDLAAAHIETPMAGRTHGQPGSPISFGYKVATWVDELGRHLQRLSEARPRLLVGQLGGAVGTLGFFGDSGLAVRAEFCRCLGLGEPSISWLTTRDRLGEFAGLVAMITSTLARIANEIYVLQSFEIGELLEPASASVVGSITMPHKRNPEVSEQVVALNRHVRAQAGLLLETMVQEHERDARGWKAEWVAFPELAHYACAATAFSVKLVSELQVVPTAMYANLVRSGLTSSEALLSRMSLRLGKHTAQQLLQDVYLRSRQGAQPIDELLAQIATADELADLDQPDLGASADMIRRVISAAAARRSADVGAWT